jgi:hypothetical protein
MIEQSKTSLKEHNKVMLLPIEDIAPSPFQARMVFDEQEIKKACGEHTPKRSFAAYQCAPDG